MSRSDKLLLAVVGGILLLVGVAVAVVLLRPAPSYRPDTTPENIVHNYLLALELEEDTRAYSYLAPTMTHYPANLAEFNRDINSYSYRFRHDRSTSLSVTESEIQGQQAFVQVVELRSRTRSLFNNTQTRTDFIVTLELLEDEWKIVDSPYYFAACWNSTFDCR